MAKKNDDVVEEKISGGGPWEGSMWFPHEPTDNAKQRAEEYKNTIVDDDEVNGELSRAEAFDKDQFALTDDDGGRLLMPEHGGLQRDLGLVIEKFGEGQRVRVVYKGTKPIKKGKWKGKEAHTYDVFAIRPKASK